MSASKHNIQKKLEMYAFLKANGYYWIRTTKHQIWSNGKYSIPVPTGKGRKINPIVADKIVKQIEQNKEKL